MALINWQNFRVQYFFIFTGLNLLKSFGFVDKVITTIGTSIVMMTTAYNLTKYVRTYFNQEFIPSVKKAVLITGADKGITYDLAIKLNEHGFRVYATVMELTAPAVESLVSDSRFANLMKVKKMDVTDEEQVNEVAKEITEELNTNQEELWAVINGAETREFGHFDWSEFKLYEKIFNVNTFGTVRVVRAFLPLIRKSKGRIINIESIAGRLTLPKLTAFCMTKHANISFADAIRRELNDSGIKVSTVELAFDREPAQAEEQSGETPSKFNKSILEQWNSTAEAIKELYGNEYLQQLKIEKLATVFKNNLDTALDDLVDAVRGQEPAVRYYPYNSLKAKLFSNLAQVLPIELLDKYYYSTEKDSPKPLMEREESLCPQETETIPKSKDD